MTEVVVNQNAKVEDKHKKLMLCIALDAVGYLSYLIPFLGEFADLVWAPISAYLLAKMFQGTVGKVGGAISFIEEAMPGLDFIPTFTLTWMYTYLFKKES